MLGVLEPSVVFQVNRDTGCPPGVAFNGGQKNPPPLPNSESQPRPVFPKRIRAREQGLPARALHDHITPLRRPDCMVPSPSLKAIFASKVVRPFTILTAFMNKRPPAKKPQAKIQTVKKQIPLKKIAPDRIEELVKKHLGNIGEAENAFKSVSALLEKHKTKYPELEQYIEHVSASDRSIQILEDIKDPRRAHYIFKILLTGVQPAYQVAHPGEKDHTNVDRAAWISTFEEALAKAIVQIVLSRQAEQASQAVGSPKE